MIRPVADSGFVGGKAGDRVRSMEAGCDSHLVIPVSLSDLQQVLAELADIRRPSDPWIS